ncbi:MAG: Unknown protein [uncultured Sulfurovum sp.]|uniref:Tox-REase-7 domain-containing protein n=1 Tax=uncultured Sulfurovum sp. TaxID=269237 RepID=A0A6S6SJC9_9BACT|nr:MAG: Unknown protein [uncultured Sulfurovum sp.]
MDGKDGGNNQSKKDKKNDENGESNEKKDASILKEKWNDWTEKEIEEYYQFTKDSKKNLSSNSPDHKSQRWQDYKNKPKSAGWDYDRWSKQYHTNMKNSSKTLREQYYRDMVQDGITPDRIKTPFTYRHLDIQIGDSKTMYEVKTGKEYYTKESSKVKLSNEERIKKDAWLIDNGYDVTWILEKGASKPLLKALKDAGIEYIIGIPKKLD